MIVLFFVMIAVLGIGLPFITLELISVKKELNRQEKLQKKLLEALPNRSKPSELERTAIRLSAAARLSGMPDAQEALDIEFERIRAGSDFVDLAQIGVWFIYRGYRNEYAKLGYKKLSDWINTLDGWEIRRDYGKYPAVLMRKNIE